LLHRALEVKKVQAEEPPDQRFFKLIHRVLDMKKVQEEMRHAELENIRLTVLAMRNEDEGPDIEKKVVIENDATVLVDTD